jgi:hypothetical protein
MAERWIDDQGDISMARHKFADPAYFEDLQIGQTFYSLGAPRGW